MSFLTIPHKVKVAFFLFTFLEHYYYGLYLDISQELLVLIGRAFGRILDYGGAIANLLLGGWFWLEEVVTRGMTWKGIFLSLASLFMPSFLTTIQVSSFLSAHALPSCHWP